MAESEDVFGLNGQIEHKLGFLLEHVPRDTHLILIGHSIGCYIILEMMKRDPELKVKSWLDVYCILAGYKNPGIIFIVFACIYCGFTVLF